MWSAARKNKSNGKKSHLLSDELRKFINCMKQTETTKKQQPNKRHEKNAHIHISKDLIDFVWTNCNQAIVEYDAGRSQYAIARGILSAKNSQPHRNESSDERQSEAKWERWGDKLWAPNRRDEKKQNRREKTTANQVEAYLCVLVALAVFSFFDRVIIDDMYSTLHIKYTMMVLLHSFISALQCCSPSSSSSSTFDLWF